MIIKIVDYIKHIERLNQVLDMPIIKVDKKKYNTIKNIKNGLHAEYEMSRILKIRFQNSDDILVLNDIKIEYKDETAQIDHLILTCYSSYFIETKTSWGTIYIDEFLDWKRCYGDKVYPFTSPLTQTQNHSKLLYDLMEDNIEKIMGKFIGLQKRLGTYKPHHYIAIGEKSEIKGKGRKLLENQILRYDQVADVIIEHHKKHAKGFFRIEKNDDEFKTMSKTELVKMGDFILSQNISEDDPLKSFKIEIEKDKPYQTQNKITAQIQINEKQDDYSINVPTAICSKCQSKISIVFGQYGYYWKCNNCTYTEGIKVICPGCKTKMKLRKQKGNYLIQCDNCKLEGLYFEGKIT